MTLDLTRPWFEHEILAVDFETTGPDPLTCEPVEIACVRFGVFGFIAKRFKSLLRPSTSIPAEATAIHGITDAMVANAPALPELATDIMAIAEDAVPLAYNRRFDRTILHRYLSGTGCVPVFDPGQPWLCVYAMAWSRDRYEPGSGRLKLTACCKRRGICTDLPAHRAEADAVSCGKLFFAIMGASRARLGDVLARVDLREQEREADWTRYQAELQLAALNAAARVENDVEQLQKAGGQG